MATEGAPGEQAALEPLLAMVELRGAIVTTDANTCSSKTAACVREAGGHYVLHLKASRRKLYDFVAGFFAAARADDFRGVTHSIHSAGGYGHGRGEVRRVWAVPFADWDLDEAAWPDLRTMVMVERTRVVGGVVTTRRHFYLTSLRARAKHLARLLREHRGVV